MTKRFVGLLLMAVVLMALVPAAPAWGFRQRFDAPQVKPMLSKLVYGADALFPPLSYEERDSGKPTGFEVELIQEIGKVMGFEVEVRLGQWSAIRDQFVDGGIDVVGMYENPSRYGLAAFGDPYAVGHSEIFVRQDGPMFDSLAALEGRSVAIEAAALASDSVKSSRPGIRWVEVGTGADVVRAVSSGEVDAGICAQFVGRWAMKEYGLTNVTTSGPPILQSNIALCVRPGRDQILRTLNDGLKIVKANGTYSVLYDKWLTPHKRSAFDWKTLVKWALLLTVPLVALIAATVVWNRTLSSRVNAKSEELRRQFDETRRAEVLLGQSRARAAALVEFAPEAILVVRRDDGRVLEANPHVERLFAIPVAELIGRPLSALMVRTSEESPLASLKLLSAGVQSPVRVSADALGAGGRPIHCEWWAVELPGDGERTLRVSVIDVSDLIEAQHRREALERELDHARQFEAMGRLAGGIVHDVNNLLTTVVGCVRLIGPEIPSGSRGHRTLATLESAADQGAGLTRRLLDYVRGSPSLTQAVDLIAVVQEAIPFLRGVVADAKLSVQWAPAPHPLWVSADPVEVRQILFNLADNAREAFLEADAPLAERLLRLSARSVQGQASLVIEDTGPGMKPEHLDRCFEPFFSTHTDTGGSGLGLSTCRDLVEGMGGTIAVSSRPGGGTRFEVLLPSAPSPLSEGVEKPKQARAAFHAPGSVSTVLLIEDNKPVREVLTSLLARTGWRVLSASGEAEALALAPALSPGDVVISDVNLAAGEPDAAQSTRLLLDLRSRVPGLRLVLMSGSQDRLVEVGRAVEGVDAALLKPFAPETLEAIVGRLLDPGAGVPR